MIDKDKLQIISVGCNLNEKLLAPISSFAKITMLASPLEINKPNHDAQILIWNNNLTLGPATLNLLPGLKYIINWGTNSNNIMPVVKANPAYEIFVVNGYATQAVADFAVNILIEKTPADLSKLKVGIIGLGKIGFSIFQKLSAYGVENFLYSASSDKKLPFLAYASETEILNSCDWVFITTSANRPINFKRVDNPGMSIVNLCFAEVLPLGQIAKLLHGGKIYHLYSDTKPLELKSKNVSYFGHIAYKTPAAIANKHAKLIYLIKRIRRGMSSRPLVVYFARHGETEKNRDGIYQGQEDSPLIERGEEQMRQVGRFLTDKEIGRILTSPLGRSKASAKIIGEIIGVEPRVHGFLREQNFGDLQGTPKKHGEAEYPGFFKDRQSNRWSKLYSPYPGGGESYFELYQRTHDPLIEVLAGLEDNAVFVGHESVNRILRGIARGLEPEDMVNARQANDELIRLDLSDLSEEIISLN